MDYVGPHHKRIRHVPPWKLLVKIRASEDETNFKWLANRCMRDKMQATQRIIDWLDQNLDQSFTGSANPSLSSLVDACRCVKARADRLARDGIWEPSTVLYRAVLNIHGRNTPKRTTPKYDAAYLDAEVDPEDHPTIREFFADSFVEYWINFGLLTLAAHGWGALLAGHLFGNDDYVDITTTPPWQRSAWPPVPSLEDIMRSFLPPLAMPDAAAGRLRLKRRAARFWLVALARGHMARPINDLIVMSQSGTNTPQEVESVESWAEALQNADKSLVRACQKERGIIGDLGFDLSDSNA